MTNEQLFHLTKILKEFETLAWAKYEAGQAEHGGDLWKKADLIDRAIEEAIDQVIYLLTLKQQIDEHKDFDKDKVRE